tara:strand:- start:2764 stop:2865 length:102 start_codon:yes stop_codon:yes gene_type:complete
MRQMYGAPPPRSLAAEVYEAEVYEAEVYAKRGK